MMTKSHAEDYKQTSKASVLIIDDNATVREALHIILQSVADLTVCGEAINATAAYELCNELIPDVALIDISLKGGNGIDLIKRLRSDFPDIKCIVFSLHNEALYIDAAREAGAHGYVTKGESPKQIIDCIRTVRDGRGRFARPYSP